MNKYMIATIAGDGIGKEVLPAAVAVLNVVAQRFGFVLKYSDYPWGCEYYASTGSMMAADGISLLAPHDAIFLGAVGYPGVPDHVSLWGLLIPIRRAFRQYVNLRPVRLLEGIPSPLRNVGNGIDLLVVRENNEGEYSEIGGRLYRDTPQEIAVQESIFTRVGVERVVRYAAGLAMVRGGGLTSATKSNGIIHTMPFWDEICAEVCRELHVSVRNRHIDALAADFVLHPSDLDVVVASNLFGDILSDLGAAVAGSVGIAPSANLNPERDFPSMFEPVHGSAPDIAGQGIANPIGQIWAGAMMLEHIGEVEASQQLISSLEAVVRDGAIRTPDIGGSASTESFTKAVIAQIS